MGDAKVNLHVCTIQVSLVLSLFSHGGNMVWKDKFYLLFTIVYFKHKTYTVSRLETHIQNLYSTALTHMLIILY